MGLLFVGIAVGPTIGGLLISKTGDLLSVFYLAASIHLLYLVSMLFIVPESLSKEEMANNRDDYAEKIKRGLEKERRRGRGFWYSCWTATKRAFFFLKPLTVFLPKERAGREKGRNWNLTYLMISYSLVAMVMVSTNAPIRRASLKPNFLHREATSTSSNMHCIPLDGPRNSLDTGSALSACYGPPT